MLDVWVFGGRSVVIVVLALALFGATAGWALSSWGRMPRALCVVVGALTSVVGVAVLGVVAMARRFRIDAIVSTYPMPHQNRSPGAGAGAAPPAPPSLTPTSTQSSGFGDLWGDGATDLRSMGTGPLGVGSSTAYKDLWNDRLVPQGDYGFSALNDAVPAPPKVRRRAWVTAPAGRWAIGIGALAAGFAAFSIFSPWISVDAAVIPEIFLYPFGTGVDIALALTIALIAIGLAISSRIPSRFAAVVIAGLADIWATLAAFTVSTRVSIVTMLEQVGDLSLSVGDVLSSFGIDIRGTRIELPQGVDLTALGITSRTVDASSLPLGEVIPNMTIGIEPGLWIIVAFAILANVATFLIIRSAEQADPPHRD